MNMTTPWYGPIVWSGVESVHGVNCVFLVDAVSMDVTVTSRMGSQVGVMQLFSEIKRLKSSSS